MRRPLAGLPRCGRGRIPAQRACTESPSHSAPAQRIDATAPARPGPLAGVRVLDFSWALVGSITTKVLGDLGAEVIKVESRARPCLSRTRRPGGGLEGGRFR